MAITDPLVLPRDVILVPVAELPEETRARFSHDEGDWAITHPRSRTPSRVLDAASAALVEQFREPRTIVEAVIRFSREKETDPGMTLEEAYPLLQRLLSSGFLVEESAAEAEGIKPSLHPGEEVGGFTVVECVQGLEDTELYLVRVPGGGAGALKIERPAVAGRSGGMFEREEAILRWIEGDGSPRLLAGGALDDDLQGGRRWLVTEWFSGVDAAAAGWELQRGGAEARGELLALARRIAEAYAALHARGVLHADVHLRNILVGAGGDVRLLDFGYSRWDAAPAELADPPRAGVAFFYEPEYAEALRAGQPLPAASPAGEQHAVAALLYTLLTGAHPRDYSLDKDEMLRQIAEEPPLPFAERGVDPWPEVEEVLRRALAKDPAERFPSLAALAAALPSEPAKTASRPRTNDLADAEALLDRVLERVRPGGELFEEGVRTAPAASVNYGAAGIACALHRMALARADGELLALADVWAERAVSLVGTEGAYYNPEIQIKEEMIGPSSLYHTAPGIHAARALVFQAQGFEGLRDEAVAHFLRAAAEPGPNQDLTLGRSGLLLGGALLLDLLPEDGETRRGLISWGEELRRKLWDELDAQRPIRDDDSVNLGLAHGWAGHLDVALRWNRSAGTGLPGRFPERLEDLAACARPWGRGVRWRWHGAEGGTAMPGWCNGSAGYLYLWIDAAEAFQEPRWRDLAERTAWNTWEASDAVTSLCCGLAGRAYALLRLWRHGGGPEWLARSRHLANRAARGAAHSDETPDSLYKGAMGVAALAADLGRPEEAAMPMFE